jgi:hypothetical protein
MRGLEPAPAARGGLPWLREGAGAAGQRHGEDEPQRPIRPAGVQPGPGPRAQEGQQAMRDDEEDRGHATPQGDPQHGVKQVRPSQSQQQRRQGQADGDDDAGPRHQSRMLAVGQRAERHQPNDAPGQSAPAESDQGQTCYRQRQPEMKAGHGQNPAEGEQSDGPPKFPRRDRRAAQPVRANGEHEAGDEQRHRAQAEAQAVRGRGAQLPRPGRAPCCGEEAGHPPRCGRSPARACPEEAQPIGRVQQPRRAPWRGLVPGAGRGGRCRARAGRGVSIGMTPWGLHCAGAGRSIV